MVADKIPRHKRPPKPRPRLVSPSDCLTQTDKLVSCERRRWRRSVSGSLHQSRNDEKKDPKWDCRGLKQGQPRGDKEGANQAIACAFPGLETDGDKASCVLCLAFGREGKASAGHFPASSDGESWVSHVISTATTVASAFIPFRTAEQELKLRSTHPSLGGEALTKDRLPAGSYRQGAGQLGIHLVAAQSRSTSTSTSPSHHRRHRRSRECAQSVHLRSFTVDGIAVCSLFVVLCSFI